MIIGLAKGERPVSLRVEPTNVEARQGQRPRVRALGILADGTTRDLTESVLWTSQSHRTATVDREGHIDGRDPGSTTVYAIVGTLAAELNVRVV